MKLSIFVPAALQFIALLGLSCGILGLFSDPQNSSWKYGLIIIASSIFLLGFSAIVKAAYKYLDKR